MKKVFLDTNVLLDFLLDRAPFTDDIAQIIDQAIYNSIKLCVSSITITNINYIIGRSEGVKSANKKTKQILELVSVENVGDSIIRKASKSKFKDFEDGVQNFCASESQHKIIVTRNVKDFKQSKLSILTPKEFLAKMKSLQ
jgi:predicted nucleic acid-binding protein